MLERFLLVRHDAYTFMFLNPTILSFTPLKVFLYVEGFDVLYICVLKIMVYLLTYLPKGSSQARRLQNFLNYTTSNENSLLVAGNELGSSEFNASTLTTGQQM